MVDFYTVKEFKNELESRGINVSEKAIRHFIANGNLKAQKEILRPKRWQIPASELGRVIN